MSARSPLIDLDRPLSGGTLRPTEHGAARLDRGADTDAEGNGENELDPRAWGLTLYPQYADMPDKDVRTIIELARVAYNTFVLLPTRSTWRKEEGSRRELERDVERTVMRDMALAIKKGVEEKIGGCWHVVYGRNFATYVTHQVRSFCHLKLDGADVVVWRHGGIEAAMQDDEAKLVTLLGTESRLRTLRAVFMHYPQGLSFDDFDRVMIAHVPELAARDDTRAPNGGRDSQGSKNSDDDDITTLAATAGVETATAFCTRMHSRADMNGSPSLVSAEVGEDDDDEVTTTVAQREDRPVRRMTASTTSTSLALSPCSLSTATTSLHSSSAMLTHRPPLSRRRVSTKTLPQRRGSSLVPVPASQSRSRGRSFRNFDTSTTGADTKAEHVLAQKSLARKMRLRVRQELGGQVAVSAMKRLFNRIDRLNVHVVTWEDVLQYLVTAASADVTAVREEVRPYTFARQRLAKPLSRTAELRRRCQNAVLLETQPLQDATSYQAQLQRRLLATDKTARQAAKERRRRARLRGGVNQYGGKISVTQTDPSPLQQHSSSRRGRWVSRYRQRDLALIQFMDGLPAHPSVFALSTHFVPLALYSKSTLQHVRTLTAHELGHTHPQHVTYLPGPDVFLSYASSDRAVRGWFNLLSSSAATVAVPPLQLDGLVRCMRTRPGAFPCCVFVGCNHGHLTRLDVPPSRSAGVALRVGRVYANVHRYADGGVTDMVMSDTHLFSIGLDHTLIATHIATGARTRIARTEEALSMLGYNESLNALLAATAHTHTVWLWDAAAQTTTQGTQLRRGPHKEHQRRIIGLHCVQDMPQVVTVDEGGTVKVWDLRMQQCVQSTNADGRPHGELTAEALYGCGARGGNRGSNGRACDGSGEGDNVSLGMEAGVEGYGGGSIGSDSGSSGDGSDHSAAAVDSTDAQGAEPTVMVSLAYFASQHEIVVCARNAIYCLQYNLSQDPLLCDVDIVLDLLYDVREGAYLFQGPTRLTTWDAQHGYRKRLCDRALDPAIAAVRREIAATCLDDLGSRLFLALTNGDVEVYLTPQLQERVGQWRLAPADGAFTEMLYSTMHKLLVGITTHGVLFLRCEDAFEAYSVRMSLAATALHNLVLSDELGLVACCDERQHVLFHDFKRVSYGTHTIALPRPALHLSFLAAAAAVVMAHENGELLFWSCPPAVPAYVPLLRLRLGEQALGCVPLYDASAAAAASSTAGYNKGNTATVLPSSSTAAGSSGHATRAPSDITALAYDDHTHHLFVGDEAGSVHVLQLCYLFAACRMQSCSYEHRIAFALQPLTSASDAVPLVRLVRSVRVHAHGGVLRLKYFPDTHAVLSSGEYRTVFMLDTAGHILSWFSMTRLPPTSTPASQPRGATTPSAAGMPATAGPEAGPHDGGQATQASRSQHDGALPAFVPPTPQVDPIAPLQLCDERRQQQQQRQQLSVSALLASAPRELHDYCAHVSLRSTSPPLPPPTVWHGGRARVAGRASDSASQCPAQVAPLSAARIDTAAATQARLRCSTGERVACSGEARPATVSCQSPSAHRSPHGEAATATPHATGTPTHGLAARLQGSARRVSSPTCAALAVSPTAGGALLSTPPALPGNNNNNNNTLATTPSASSSAKPRREPTGLRKSQSTLAPLLNYLQEVRAASRSGAARDTCAVCALSEPRMAEAAATSPVAACPAVTMPRRASNAPQPRASPPASLSRSDSTTATVTTASRASERVTRRVCGRCGSNGDSNSATAAQQDATVACVTRSTVEDELYHVLPSVVAQDAPRRLRAAPRSAIWDRMQAKAAQAASAWQAATMRCPTSRGLLLPLHVAASATMPSQRVSHGLPAAESLRGVAVAGHTLQGAISPPGGLPLVDARLTVAPSAFVSSITPPRTAATTTRRATPCLAPRHLHQHHRPAATPSRLAKGHVAQRATPTPAATQNMGQAALQYMVRRYEKELRRCLCGSHAARRELRLCPRDASGTAFSAAAAATVTERPTSCDTASSLSLAAHETTEERREDGLLPSCT